jgi:hypothetical protein
MSSTIILETIEKIKALNTDTLEQNQKMKEIINTLYEIIESVNEGFRSLSQPPQPPQPATKYKSVLEKSMYDIAIELPLTLDNLNQKISCYNVLKYYIDNDKNNREKWEKDLEDETVSIIEKLKIKISLRTSSLMPEWIKNYNEIQEQIKQYELLYDTF